MTRRLSTSHPCVFKSAFLREQVDPRIEAAWPNAPFGNLRKLWRERACAETNPYGSDTCPYSTENCALAFLQAVERTVYAMPRKPTAYFRSVALTIGMERAERKPLARESQEGPGYRDGQDGGVATRWGMRRADTRPTGVGEVLRQIAARSHQGQPTDGSEGTKR